MEAVAGLLVMLLGVAHGMETSCDGRQDGTQCYGALGETVVVQLMDSASGIARIEWKKEKTLRILRMVNNYTTFDSVIQNRSFFTPSNGTLRINNLIRNDSGEYTLRITNEQGKQTEQRTLQLTVQAPVSSVQLVSECLSQGQMRVSCSSEGGDSPQYSWTLDGRTLTDAELLSGNSETNIITLKQDVSVHLVCSVRNHVSSVSRGETISTCVFINCTLSSGTQIPPQWVFANNNTLCIEPTTSPTTITDPGKETVTTVSFKPSTNITSSNQTVTQGDPLINMLHTMLIVAGVLSALVIFLVIGVAVICTQKKKKNHKPKEEENEHELTYADVKIVQRQERQVKQRAEEEVEYGQVKISERPRRAVEPKGDDCVYAKVCRVR